ncbi:universal stress protein [Thermodesulfobacterium sp. TA1]|uniref:universal stress protein n=1 Tax=Thermodesulfobacterium sp. TA1 TaxID=2234087 RepID=UPI0012318B47|nr:universal stress protein [Thermodesulfobacterium sp. TA1]QER42744.1 universal stress protein [Thermodesulfobacterium sp. TA1]
MKPYQKPLIALDTSEQSWHVFLEALKLLQTSSTKAAIVTVAPLYTDDLLITTVEDLPGKTLPGFEEIFTDLPIKIIQPYQELIKKVENVLSEKRIEAQCFLEKGEAYQKIVDLAYNTGADLIIMGRSSSKLKTFFLGSTAARVIGYSPVDVLIIPYPRTINLEKILVAVDGSSFAEKAFAKAITLAKAHQSKLSVVSVIDLPVETYGVAPDVLDKLSEERRKYLENLVDKANKEGVKIDWFLKLGAVEDKILEVAQETGSGLLVMGTYGKTGLKRLLMGSVTERVLSAGALPVLVVK